MESINILRLKTGEDIICYMEHYGHDEVVVRDAMSIFLKMDMKTGKQNVMMDHWLPAPLIRENEAIIKMSEVLAVMQPTTDFTDYYENSIATIKKFKDNFSDTAPSSDDDGLTADDMNLILEMVGPTNQMH